MTMRSKTIRAFVSPTFEALKAERNALQDRVFPDPASYCQRHGWQFQAVGLRWDVSEETATDRELACLCGHEDAVTSVGFSPDGTRLASTGPWGDSTVRVWDAATGRPVAWFPACRDHIATHPDGRTWVGTGRYYR